MKWRPWSRAGVTVALVVAAACSSSGPSTARVRSLPLPTSMAAAGDSITQAFDVDSAGFLKDNPAESWSTGSDAAVDSQYQRLLAAEPAMAGHVYDDAVSGAKMSAVDGQLMLAASQQVDYVTVLSGADDLCTSSVAAMTPTATFSQEFSTALSDFFARDPHAHVLVASIPNLFQLWSALHANVSAQIVWALAHVCQSMLAFGGTAADRQAVVDQEVVDNAALASVCGQHPNCRFDGEAVYRVAFTAADVSTVDYFHPGVTGQARLAAVTWAAGYWPSVR